MTIKDPHSAERQLFQLQKKGFEDVNKNLEKLAAPDISGIQKTLEEIRDKEDPKLPEAVEEITVKNQLDLKTLEEGVSSIVEAIKDKKFDGTDTAGIEALLQDILDKKDSETDLSPVITAINDLTNFLKKVPQTKGIDYTKDFKELARVITEARPGSAGFNPGSVGVKNVAGDEVNVATSEKQDEIIAALGGSYSYVQKDDAGAYIYFGYASSTGYQIKRKTTATGIWMVVTGTGDYATNWASRASKTYVYA